MYAGASVCALPAVLGSRVAARRAAVGLAVGAWVCHLVSFLETLVAAHRLIPVGMHEVQSTLSLLIASAFLVIVAVYQTVSFGIFALPLAFLLALPSALGPDQYTFSSPLVRGGWIFIHVTALLAADAAMIFSLLASLLYLLQERRLKDKQRPRFLAWLPPLETMDRIAQTALVFGFACMTVGLFVGSFIAQEKVGSAYFLDPKVLLSFAMWVLYMVMLWVRRSTGLRGRRAIFWSSTVVLLMLSVWAANLLSSVHRFGQP
ncbi:MAG TPA: cytochrome c biogenesis protein CcsA [Acidobacteriaceae bacterium]